MITILGGAGSCNMTFSSGGVKTILAEYWESSDSVTHTVRAEQGLNGGFNTYVGKSRIPKDWKASKFALTDGKDLKVKKEGTASVKIMGGTTATKTLTQTLALTGAAGDVLTLAYWVKGAALAKGGTCQADVTLYNGAAVVVKKIVKCPTTATFTWKKLTADFTAPGAFTKAVIKISFKKAGGIAWFDGVSLKK
jgi:hypothetical protein